MSVARGDEAFSQASTRRGLTGFVSYMERKDAERAVKELDGSEWMGNSIRVGWSKPVAKPLKALFGESFFHIYHRKKKGKKEKSLNSNVDITSDSHKRRRSRSRSRGRSPPRKKSHRARSYSYSSSSSYSRSPSPERTCKQKWLDSIPEEHGRFIKTVANRVKEHGKGFEDVLMEKERENPKFAFLYDDKACGFSFFFLSRVLLTRGIASRLPPLPIHTFITLPHSVSTARSIQRRRLRLHLLFRLGRGFRKGANVQG